MSTAKMLRIVSTSSDFTEQLGERLGHNLVGGETIELTSDLGGGKTTFVRGVARGMGSAEKVTSPTFTVSKIYKAERLELHHFDFYRLPEAGLIRHELSDILGDDQAVIVTEWADVVRGVLPEDRLEIRIEKTGDRERAFHFIYPEKLSYLVRNLC